MRRPVSDYFAIIDAAGEFVHASPIAAEMVLERKQIHTSVSTISASATSPIQFRTGVLGVHGVATRVT